MRKQKLAMRLPRGHGPSEVRMSEQAHIVRRSPGPCMRGAMRQRLAGSQPLR